MMAEIEDLPKCHRCGAPLKRLICRKEVFVVSEYFSNGEYEGEYSEVVERRFECPHCGALIAKSEKDAHDFLASPFMCRARIS